MTEQRLLPGPEDLRFFSEQGFWISPQLFDEESLDAARAHAASVCEGTYEKGESPEHVYPGPFHKLDNVSWADPVLERMARSPIIGRIAAELLGVEEIVLWAEQLLWKPYGDEAIGAVGFHQDKRSWVGTGTTEMITAWVAFDDVTSDMGAMRLVPGSHRWGFVCKEDAFFRRDLDAQRATIPIPAGARWREFVAEMRAGQACFHHCMTVHGSGANTTRRPRRSLSVHLISGKGVRTMHRSRSGFALVLDHDVPWNGQGYPRLWP